MKRLFFALLTSLGFIASCNNPKYEVVDYLSDSTPLKSTVTKRVVLLDPVSKDNVQRLLDIHFYEAAKTKMEHHGKPTHVFIYVYPDMETYKEDPMYWVGQKSLISGKEDIQIKNEYFEKAAN